MNRKQRRASNKTQPAGKTLSPPREIFAAAVQCHREGRLDDAARFYRQVLAVDPGHADSLHRLGVIAHQNGQHDLAADMLRQAIGRAPQVASYHTHMGLVLDALGYTEEAVASCRTAVALDPDLPDLHNNLGVLLLRLGRHEDAIASYRKAIALAPGLVEAHNNLGNILLELGKLQEAEECYRRVISLVPDFAEGHANLGAVLQSTGRSDEAAACFQRALRIAPAQAGIRASLALAQLAMGDHRAALATALSALATEETPQTRRLFVQCVKDIRIESEIAGLRPLLLRALREAWDRPDDLARPCADLIKQTHAGLLAPEREPRADDFAALAGDELLQALLCQTPNQDLALEALLTTARRRLLLSPPQASTELAFGCALARQCFLNEYVFALEDQEAEQARGLSDEIAAALAQGSPIHPYSVAAVAAYFPLLSLPHAGGLLERSWPTDLDAVLTQQIREPKEEEALRALIPRLTEIKDDVSRSVRGQYEDPYPRWVVAASAEAPQPLSAYVRHNFPFASLEELNGGRELDILVAGCGTGRNAIETTQKFLGARTLAIDLSLHSLAHAARKTREMGIQAIDYAQADILELGGMERRFDLIEAVGVLHHLADPFTGWRVLTSLLKPHGLMLVGLYSGEGRRDLPENSGGAADVTAADVRRARRHLAEQGGPVTERMDFFTTSTCRDLLFHVQEHRLTLAGIGGFLAAHNLRLLGFSLEDAVLAAYRRRFPGDPGAVNLDCWQAYEKDHPDTFSGMYQFWLQKTL